MSKVLKVLLLRPKAIGSYQISIYRSFFSILKELQREISIIEIWVVEQGGNDFISSDSNAYNIFHFSDALELVDKLKPDLIFVFSDYEFLSRSILSAAAYRKIPSMVLMSLFFEMDLLETVNLMKVIKGRIVTLRTRGLIVIKKYNFLMRTQKRIHYRWTTMISTMLRDIYYSVRSFEPRYRFGGGDLNIVSTPQAKELLLARGIRNEKILVTGDCGMDYLYEKLHLRSTSETLISRKEQILFITEPMVEHGYWTDTEREIVVTSVVKTIIEAMNKTHNLRIKIHPTSESLEIYRNILNRIDSSIEIIQDGDIVPLIQQSDLIIALGHSSAIFPAVLLSKPIILVNILNDDLKGNIFLNSGLAIECNNVQDLVELIRTGNCKAPNNEHLKKFIEKTIYRFDGQCSRRAARGILSLLKTRIDS